MQEAEAACLPKYASVTSVAWQRSCCCDACKDASLSNHGKEHMQTVHDSYYKQVK